MSHLSPFTACIELARYASLSGVSFRVLADGTVETDSVEDALKLRAALLRQEARRPLPDSDDLPVNAKVFLVQVAATPSGLTSEEISKCAGIPTKSIPPLIRGLGYWATRHGLKLDSLLSRKQTFNKGKPISTYILTKEGHQKFQKFLKPPSAEKQSTDNQAARRGTAIGDLARRLADFRWTDEARGLFQATCPVCQGGLQGLIRPPAWLPRCENRCSRTAIEAALVSLGNDT